MAAAYSILAAVASTPRRPSVRADTRHDRGDHLTSAANLRASSSPAAATSPAAAATPGITVAASTSSTCSAQAAKPRTETSGWN